MHYSDYDYGGGGDGGDDGDGGGDGDDVVVVAVVVLVWSYKTCWNSLCRGRSCIVRKGDHSGCE